MSESEAEDDESSHVTLPQKLSSRGNHANSKSAIRLFELGPRITLQVKKLIKINTSNISKSSKIYNYLIFF